MAGSIKLFQFVQKCHQAFGIHQYQSNPNPSQDQHSTNSVKTVFLISFVQFMCTTAAFFLLAATSMFHYGFVFFLLVTISNGVAIYLIFVYQSKNTLKFIQKCERFIGKSKCNCSLYSLMEWSSKWLRIKKRTRSEQYLSRKARRKLYMKKVHYFCLLCLLSLLFFWHRS